MFTRFSLNPAKNALAYRTTSSMTSDFPCIPHPFALVDRTIDAKGVRRSRRCPLAREAGCEGGRRQTKPPPGARAKPKGPRRANPCISIVFWNPRQTGACGAEARMHGLGTLTRGTQRILATSPLRRGLSPQRKPPRRQRGPGADGARRSGGSQHAARQNRPGPMGRVRGGWRVPGKGTRNAIYENRPGPMGKPGADGAACWREGRPTHGDRQSAPWREEDAQGALAFRIGYFSFGASFTS